MQKTRKLISMLLAVMMVLSMCTVGMVSVSALPENAVISDVEGNDASSIDGELYGLMGDADANGTINVKDATQIQKFAAKLVELDETSEALADVDLDGKVNVKDATAIQKWVAKYDVDMPINCLVYFPTQETTATEPTTQATVPTSEASEDEPTTAASEDETKPSVPVIIIPTTVATEPTETTTATEPTETTVVTEPSEVVTTAEATTAEATTVAQETEATTVASDDTVTIYFQNNWMWGDVRAYAWNDAGQISEWPGDAMTFVENDGNYDIYSYVVPVGVTGIVISGTKDTAPDTRDQTPDIESWYNGQCFYMMWDSSLNEGQGGNAVDSFEYIVPTEATTVTEEATTASTAAEDTEATTASTAAEDTEATTAASTTAQDTEATTVGTTTEADDGMITVYFTNNKGWTNVNVHYWCTTSEGTEFPGVAMNFYKTNSYNQDIYSYDIPADAEGVNFVGVDDSGNKEAQTVSIKYEKGNFMGDGYGYYCTEEESAGKWLVESFLVEEPEETTATETTADKTTTAETDPTETTVADSTTAPVVLVKSDYVLHGNFSGSWADVVLYISAEDSNIATATMTVEAGSYEFVMHNTATDEWLKNGGTIEDACEGWRFGTDKDGNTTFTATGGTYTFSFDLTTLMLSVVKGEVVDPTEATTTAAATTVAQETEATTVAQETDPTETTVAQETEATTVAQETEATTVAQETETTTAAQETETTTAAQETETTTAPEETTTVAQETETTTAPEETTTAPQETEPEAIKVYCINSAKWDAVCAYYWGGASVTWPGKAMTKTGETVNGFDVYEYTFEVAPQNIIFNNNNKGAQTADLTFQAGQYFDVKGGKWYKSLGDVPAVSASSTDRYLVGSFNGWSTTANEFLSADGTIGRVEMELAANTTYEFKIVREGTWTSCKETLSITDSATGLTFSSSVADNTKLTTKNAGTYVFEFDISASQLTVTYP